MNQPTQVVPLRLPEVLRFLGISRATLYRWMKQDQTFPRSFHLGPGVSVWDEADIRKWVAERKRASHRGII